ncbi:uncharacterized protein LOC135843683 [Planococcus citri]|uniref:uncharacterized protein LOC135843683 n=1 Tax=Planococcus citri TaxID=170843 RepID=UPI0031FA2327
MTNEGSPESTIPAFTVKEFADDQKPVSKPLYKLKIEDLLSIPVNEETSNFTFRNHDISLVMFGGKIESICCNDAMFSFYVTDGSNKIICFYKRKDCITSIAPNTIRRNKFLNRASEVNDDAASSSDSDDYEDENIDEVAQDDHIPEALAKESEGIVSEVLDWFNNEVVPAVDEKIENVGDIIHVSGQLHESESERKVNVIEFRIVENEIEHKDFLLEMEYLYRKLY